MRILFCGGGTLGPVTPLLALAEELKKRGNAAMLFVGTPQGPKRELVERAGIPFRVIRAPKLDRFFHPRVVLLPFLFIWAFVRAIGILLSFKPDVVVSAGAYVAVPFVYAAFLLRVPTVIHQMDIEPGLSNRLMAPAASMIAVSTKSLESAFRGKKVFLTGIPVRRKIREITSRRGEIRKKAFDRFGLDKGVPTLLAMGGGSGALQLNRLMRESLDSLLKEANVIHLAGPGKASGDFKHPRYYTAALLGEEEMGEAYALADTVVSRAGMGALAELACLKIPFVLLPMPRSHQERNAALFHEHAKIPVLGPETTSGEFGKTLLHYLLNTGAWPGSFEAMERLLPSDGAERIASLVEEAAKKKRPARARHE